MSRMAVMLVTSSMVAIAVTGCASSPTTPSTSLPASASSQPQSVSTPATAPIASATRPADLAHLSITLEPRWSGLDAPVYLTSAHDGSGRLFVVEQAGRIRVIRDGKLSNSSFLDIRQQVTYGGERGLLGLAFSPSYAINGRFYVDYVDTNGDTVIARGIARDPSSDTPHLSSLGPILRIQQPPYPNHKGGGMQFGPDGYLYIGMGDGGSAGDPGNRAQNPRLLLGKLLRIDPDHASGSAQYAIPPGQPIHAKWAPEVFSLGLRNPWRFSFDSANGDLWIGDVGQDAWEEIDVAPAGAGGQNWGWNIWEGDHPYPPGSSARKSGLTFPVAEYPHPRGESITGGYVYRGAKYPALVGTYLYADFVKGWLGALRTTSPDGQPLAAVETRTMLTGIGQPASFGADEAGELYLIDYQGSIFAIAAALR